MIERHHKNHRMSQVVAYPASAKVVVTAGIVSDKEDADVAEQTRDVLARIDALLADAGASKSNIIQIQIWLPHITDFERMNAVYDQWVDQSNPPVRACVESRIANPKFKVEIQAHAVVG